MAVPLAAIPTGPVDVPGVVVRLAAGDSITPVWRNELGGLTFRLTGSSGSTRYVKWSAAGTPEIDLAAEAERLAWAGRWISVPVVRETGSTAEGSWLLTDGIDALSAVDPRWIAEPETAVRAIGRGLRHLHDSLPIDSCPFAWSADTRILRAGLEFDPPPPVDRLVVCHGDACAPNTLIDADGDCAAQVDLGALGVADRWADIAVAAWSTEWNYGPGYEELLYEAYGVDPDPERIKYYRALWRAS
jgi:kanamycin kinase